MYNQLFNQELQDKMTHFFLNELSILGRIKAYDKNSIIDPDNANYIYIVVDGDLNQVLYSHDGDEIIFCRLERGNIFGEMDFFDGDRTCIVTKAITACAISKVPRALVEERLGKEPDLYKHFIHSIVRKYRIIMLEFADIRFNDSLGKIAHTLVRLTYSTSKKIHDGEGTLPINMYFTHEELANRINANRSTITNGLKTFKEQGYIDIDGKKITVTNIEGLKKYINLYLPE